MWRIDPLCLYILHAPVHRLLRTDLPAFIGRHCISWDTIQQSRLSDIVTYGSWLAQLRGEGRRGGGVDTAVAKSLAYSVYTQDSPHLRNCPFHLLAYTRPYVHPPTVQPCGLPDGQPRIMLWGTLRDCILDRACYLWPVLACEQWTNGEVQSSF